MKYLFFILTVLMPQIFSDNMVLQQQSDVALWGTATPGARVTVSATWPQGSASAKADKDGNWFVRIATPSAGGPYSLTVSDGKALKFNNVMIGEVWLCSGQSNMEMPVKGFTAQPVDGSTEAIYDAAPDIPIRLIKVKRNPRTTEQKDVETTGWQEHTPAAVAEFSAAGYFFGKRLQRTLGVPVGLIESDWGGTSIKAWCERSVVGELEPTLDLSHLDSPDGISHKPLAVSLYNGMIAPLAPYTLKGWIWYQGESNRNQPDLYVKFQTAYARMMREKFRNPDMPFYFVQIAPYRYEGEDGMMSGLFCEAQEKTLDLIPHSGMATTLDIGAQFRIHPSNKIEVGNRLAYLALYNDYGITAIDPRAPRVQSVEFTGEGRIYVRFDKPVGPHGTFCEGFEAACADEIYFKARAKVINQDRCVVEVFCNEAASPKYVRYAWRNYMDNIGALKSDAGIPVGPFRASAGGAPKI